MISPADKPLAPSVFRGVSLILLLVILAVMTILLLRELGNPHLGYPDADRIMMDGVFLRDFFADLPFSNPYDYIVAYYGQYPALSIGYRPPFYPFVEALFNAVFGVNTWSSRLALLAFALVGVTAWYALISRVYDTKMAFGAGLLLVTTPFLVQWGWYTMGELPLLSMTMLTAYIFFRYTETDRRSYLFAAAILFSLTVWTKQTAVYLILWFLIYLLLKGKLVIMFRKPDAWIAVGIVLLLLIPLAVVTVWLGDQNIEQSIGPGSGNSLVSFLSWDNLKVHMGTLYRSHLSKPALVLSLVGLVWSLARRDGKSLYFWLLIITTYLFFTYIAGKNARYPIFWIPAFAVFAVLPFYYLRHLKNMSLIGAAVILAVSAFQIHAVYGKLPQYATGYDEAAEYILSHSRSPTVFFDGYNNGYFTYFMRAKDPDRSMYVIRGDKMLSSSSIKARHRMRLHAHSSEDIIDIFERYGIEYIVVESRDQSGIGIHRKLRELLDHDRFKLVHQIDVKTNRVALFDQKLLVYRYRDVKPLSNEYLNIRLPVVGLNIRAPIRKTDRREID